jgi:hypothetical protein
LDLSFAKIEKVGKESQQDVRDLDASPTTEEGVEPWTAALDASPTTEKEVEPWMAALHEYYYDDQK